ncbi:ATP-dependent endonuclease [Alicyclobacillus fodiniaquatilis]|uniref:ATP-dependent endonuclease n=1 Tax=Alicyclobacillus fodiniaquatilis TaxID=1661150 RepID=A0ABW4JHF1_9BACL
MEISKIEIYNYRLLKDLKLDLERNLSLIIGKNNTGKTSVLSILNKFIGDRSTSNTFMYDDFNLEFKNSLFEAVQGNGAKWDSIYKRGIELYLFIKYDKNDNLANINPLMLDLDPDNNTVVVKFEYTLSLEKMSSLVESFSQYYARTSPNEDPSVEMSASFNTFMRTKHRRFFQIKKKAILFDVVSQKPIETEYRILDSKVVDFGKVVSFKYVAARRDTVNSDNDGTLSALSNKYYERTKTDDSDPVVQKFEDELIKTDSSLTEIYQGIFDDVIQKVKKFGGIRENETVVKIISTLSQQQLLRGNTTVVYEADNHQLPESYNGLGYLNLINVIFEIETILSEFRYDKDEAATPADINLLFIEEPEAHTHPQMQYVFIKNIKALLHEGSCGENIVKKFHLQTIVTTHSSHIVSACDFDDIKYFRMVSQARVYSKNLKDLKIAYKDEKDPEDNHFKFLKQYLTLNCAEIFFADKAILFEGDTERILLPAMMRKLDQEETSRYAIPLLSQNISLIEVGAHSQIFDKFLSFIGIKTLIITDIDAGIERKRDSPNKDGQYATDIVASTVETGTHTTNGALKHYYSSPMKEATGTQLSFFTELPLSQKALTDTSGSWTADDDGSLMLVYQTLETVNGNDAYYPRSFEDAFFHVNRKFVVDNASLFVSLKHRDCLSETNEGGAYKYDAFCLAEKCIKSKASFAMDILLNSLSADGIDFSNWETPRYIKEGLLWLREDLKMK